MNTGGYRRQRRGAIVVLVAICLPIILVMAAFAVNLAYMELVRSELRTATDAAARAGSRTLSLTGDQVSAVTAAVDAAAHNTVGGAQLQLSDTDVEVGRAERPADMGRFAFTAGSQPPNSVRVLGRLASDALTGPARMPFVRVFDRSHFGASQQAIATHIDRDISLVLDRSGSMAYAIDETYTGQLPANAPPDWQWGDPAPPESRWLKLVDAATAFLQKLADTPMDETVSLSTFAGDSTVDQDLTLDYSLVSAALDVHSQSFAGGSTSIGYGMDAGIRAVAERGYDRPWAAKTMVVMTDGIHNSGLDPSEVISVAQEYGVTVHTVTFSDEADQAAMHQIASQCNGKHWHAPSGEELIQAFREIVDNCPTLLTE